MKNLKDRKPLIEIENAVKSYGEGDGRTFALRNVDLTIYEGEFVVILGESGSGKSTLLNIMGGVDKLDEGSVRMKGVELSNMTAAELSDYRRDQIGFIFQFFNLINDLTVYQNITLAPGACTDRAEVERILDSVGILPKKDNYPHQLSGGQQQRASIARALNKRSDVILCDEPTGALDEASGKEVLKLLYKLNAEEGKTIVIVTHAEKIAGLADRVIHMKDARISDISMYDRRMSIGELFR